MHEKVLVITNPTLDIDCQNIRCKVIDHPTITQNAIITIDDRSLKAVYHDLQVFAIPAAGL